MKLRADLEKYPVIHLIVVALFAVGLVSLPLSKLFALFITDKVTAFYLGESVLRFLLSAVAIIFIIKYGFKKAFTALPSLKGALAVIPFFIIAVNNAPIIALATGNAVITANGGRIVLFLLYCLSIATFEETVFRGILFPIALKLTEKFKFGVFWAAVISSAIFAVSHLINLFNGAGVGETFLQVGYSFLIGGACAVSLAITKNLFVPIAVHFIYDIGGFMLGVNGIGYGNQWDLATIILTAILGAIVLTYTLLVVFKLDYDKVNSQYLSSEIENKRDDLKA